MKKIKVKIPVEGYVIVDLEVDENMEYDDIIELASEESDDYTELFSVLDIAEIIE